MIKISHGAWRILSYYREHFLSFFLLLLLLFYFFFKFLILVLNCRFLLNIAWYGMFAGQRERKT